MQEGESYRLLGYRRLHGAVVWDADGVDHEPRSRNVKFEILGNLSKEIKKAFKSVWESDLGWFYKGESPLLETRLKPQPG